MHEEGIPDKTIAKIGGWEDIATLKNLSAFDVGFGRGCSSEDYREVSEDEQKEMTKEEILYFSFLVISY